MKTKKNQIELMIPNQLGKDIVFNDAMQRIDNLMHMNFKGFISEEKNLESEINYINQQGEIIYRKSANEDIQKIAPILGMIGYHTEDELHYFYNGDSWQEMHNSSNGTRDLSKETNKVSSSSRPREVSILPKEEIISNEMSFTGIEGNYDLDSSKSFHHLYINNDVEINVDQIKRAEVTIIIKQHYQSVRKLIWPYNVLWSNGKDHKLSQTPNNIDVVRLYRMPETTHLLGEIIAQNCKF